MRSLRLRKLIVTRLIGLLATILLIGLLVFIGRMVQGIRGQLIDKQIRLEESLSDAVRQAVLDEQLHQYSREIERVRGMVPWRDEIGQVVESIEGEAKNRGLTVIVPKIMEEPVYNENGEVIEQTGPTRLIRIKVEGAGEPIALINFMHAVEHLPYLLKTLSFMLDNEVEGGALGPVIAAPVDNVADEALNQPRVKVAILKIDLLLTVRVTEGE